MWWCLQVNRGKGGGGGPADLLPPHTPNRPCPPTPAHLPCPIKTTTQRVEDRGETHTGGGKMGSLLGQFNVATFKTSEWRGGQAVKRAGEAHGGRPWGASRRCMQCSLPHARRRARRSVVDPRIRS